MEPLNQTVFPAHAGMSPTPAYTGELTISFPRSRGDEPASKSTGVTTA